MWRYMFVVILWSVSSVFEEELIFCLNLEFQEED